MARLSLNLIWLKHTCSYTSMTNQRSISLLTPTRVSLNIIACLLACHQLPLSFNEPWIVCSKSVVVYIDDILLTGRSQEEHLANLNKVLGKLEEVGLKCNKDKCFFMAPRVEYLGFVIDKVGLHPTQTKVQAIRQAKIPTNVTELKAFLGMLNYYGKFLEKLSTKLAPLYSLLCKNTRWKWEQEQQQAFASAKELLQSDALLVHFDPDRELILSCDASPYGVGAVLLRKTNRLCFQDFNSSRAQLFTVGQGSRRHSLWSGQIPFLHIWPKFRNSL